MLDEGGYRPTGFREVPALQLRAEDASGELDFDPLELIAQGAANAIPASGERALLLAVLEDGIRCYFSPIARVRAEAEHWVESGLRLSAFSFDVLCEVFGVEPGAARCALRRMRQRQPSGRMPRRRRRAERHRVVALAACPS